MRRWFLLTLVILVPLAFLAGTALWLNGAHDSRDRVLEAGSALAVEVVIEEPVLDPTFTGQCEEAWERITTDRGAYAYLTLNTKDPAYSTNSGTWKPTLPQAGFYRVEAYIPAHAPVVWCSSGRTIYSDTIEARYEIHHALGVTTQSVSQRGLKNQWLDLGAYPFKSGDTGYVFLDDLNGEENFASTISYSAMRFTYLGEILPGYLPIVANAIPTATPAPGVVVSNKPGFDACILPSLSKMQTWWNSSPYWIYGLYLGGSSFASGCSKADAAWVSAVRQQGWSFIPTWVGPQAPCSIFKNKMSSDPAVAYQQGRAEAEAAFVAAASVGLITPQHGTILYYDLEGFGSTASQECRAAAKAFIDGWTGRLHELGQRAGAYGSGCSSHISDWVDLVNVPDNIWAASWYTNTYDAQASVFGVLCLSNSLWANHQRIRQYAGGHKEVWGGQSHTIDSNIADGEVAVPMVAGAALQREVAAPGQLVIQDMGWLTEQQGWLLAGGKLFWTADGGVNWAEKTPVEGKLAAAVLINSRQGWALPLPAGQGDYRAYQTEDGGKTWQEQRLPLPDGDWQPLQIAFSDPLNGWATYRLMTSSIFSQGILLKTEDGGKTWTTYDLPIGEKVFFDSPLSGWTAGGVAGNELYLTHDGGRTWQAENPKMAVLPSRADLESDKQLAASLPGQVAGAVFPVEKVGWAITIQGECQGEKTSLAFACRQVSTLWKTVDGGANWEAVHLPEAEK